MVKSAQPRLMAGLLGITLLGSAGLAEAQNRDLRVVFFYNTALFKDSLLLDETVAIFSNAPGVQVSSIPYSDSNDFCERCKMEISRPDGADIILGPSDSDSLKSLDKALAQRTPVPFLAPFVTTKPADYSRLALISASPTDEKRVRASIEQFARYTANRALGCLFSDDPWGQGIAKAFREQFAKQPITVLTQPVLETEVDSSTGVRSRRDNSELYTAFLQQMRKQGARVLAVALLDSKSVNDFLASLSKLNQQSWLRFKPTILLLNQPTFDEARTRKGILAEYAQQFRIVYVRDQIAAGQIAEAKRPILSHLDACRVIAAAARIAPPKASDPPGQCAAVGVLREFYNGAWPDSDYEQVEPQLTTGFHRAPYSTARDVEVVQAVYSNGRVGALDVRKYFEGGFWRQVFWKSCFFLSHYPSLWRPEIALPFLAVCFGSFLHMVWFGAMKPLFLIWRTRSFWLLFTLNLLLTYSAWVVSVRYGVFAETDWLAPLLLAGLCPSAASALADLIKRFLPMLNLNGVFQILNEMNNLVLESIGREELTKYQKWLATYPPHRLKTTFQEVLFLETVHDTLRNRFIERLRKRLEGVPKDDPEVDQQQRTAQIYSESLVQLVAYLATSRADLWRRLDELFPRTEASESPEPANPEAEPDGEGSPRGAAPAPSNGEPQKSI